MDSTDTSSANEILTRCSKCRKDTPHKSNVQSAKGSPGLQCEVCGRQRRAQAKASPQKPARRATPVKKTEQMEWLEMREQIDSKQARAYSMTASYKLSALIDHPTFGLGQVQRVIGSQKIEVLFAEGKKTMRCG